MKVKMAEKERGNLMNALEKILEEIKKARESIIDMSDEEPELCDVEDWLEEGEKDGKMKAYLEIEKIIRSHMDAGKDTKAPTNDWIPVSDRLPEIPEENPLLDDKPLDIYIVDIGEYYPIKAFWNGKNFTNGWRILKVIAWQPLPEPYKGGCDE